jgi:hypothetical protein
LQNVEKSNCARRDVSGSAALSGSDSFEASASVGAYFTSSAHRPEVPDFRPALVKATQVGGLRVTASTLSQGYRHTARLFIYEIPISRLATPPRFLMAFRPCQQPRQKEIGEITMADRPMTDEGSKGGRNSVLIFGVVAATLTVLLILVGVAGKSVAPNTPLSNTESPATSGSQNP